MESQNSSDPNVDFTISRSNEIAKSDSHEIKINIIETTELTTYPDCLNFPPVSDVIYNNAINCDDLDEQIENNEDHIENLKPAISTLYVSDNTYHTKTARLLEQVIGANELITEFDSKRWKLKQNLKSSMYVNDYRNIVARLEVVILVKYHKLKCKMRDIEKESLFDTPSLNVVPKDCDEYNNIIHKLKLLQIIKTELQI